MSLTRRLLLIGLVSGLFAASLPESKADNPPPLSLIDASKNRLRAETTGNGRDQLRVVITNSAPEAVRVAIPAGLILRGGNGDRVIVLRSAEISLAGNVTAEAEVPTAALSSRNILSTQPFSPSTDAEQKLAGFLKFLATHDDIPRATSQLVVLALLENLTFAQWQQFTAAQREPDAKAAAGEVIQAIDALGLLREVAPDGTFALAGDNQLKLRALRNPVTRAKAVQLYRLDSPDGAAPVPADAPNLKQLLHTQPGDNCPVCRMREKASRGAGDF